MPRVAEALRPLRPSDRRRSKAIKCSVIIVAAGDERERNEWASATQGKGIRRINGDQSDTGDDVARAKIINYTHTDKHDEHM